MMKKYSESNFGTVIKGLGDAGGSGNILEILQYQQPDFQLGFDITLAMQNRDLIKLLYSNYTQHKIIAEFTLLGKKAYENLQ